jgi:hypothetical protein
MSQRLWTWLNPTWASRRVVFNLTSRTGICSLYLTNLLQCLGTTFLGRGAREESVEFGLGDGFVYGDALLDELERAVVGDAKRLRGDEGERGPRDNVTVVARAILARFYGKVVLEDFENVQALYLDEFGGNFDDDWRRRRRGC